MSSNGYKVKTSWPVLLGLCLGHRRLCLLVALFCHIVWQHLWQIACCEIGRRSLRLCFPTPVRLDVSIRSVDSSFAEAGCFEIIILMWHSPRVVQISAWFVLRWTTWIAGVHANVPWHDHAEPPPMAVAMRPFAARKVTELMSNFRTDIWKEEYLEALSRTL